MNSEGGYLNSLKCCLEKEFIMKNKNMKQKFNFYSPTLVACLLLLVVVQTNAQGPLPEVEIRTPVEGQIYEPGEDIKLSIKTSGFTFVDFKNNRELYVANPDAGHADVWVVPAGNFIDSLNHDEAKKVLSDFNFIKFPAMETGEYKFVVELVRNDHSSFDPPIREVVSFRVGAPSGVAQLRDADSSYTYTFLGFVILLAGFLGLGFYKRFSQKRKIETASEGLPLSNPGGQKTAGGGKAQSAKENRGTQFKIK